MSEFRLMQQSEEPVAATASPPDDGALEIEETHAVTCIMRGIGAMGQGGTRREALDDVRKQITWRRDAHRCELDRCETALRALEEALAHG